jgi:hypothetical protein
MEQVTCSQTVAEFKQLMLSHDRMSSYRIVNERQADGHYSLWLQSSGRLLQDEHTLAMCDIRHESTLTVVSCTHIMHIS